MELCPNCGSERKPGDTECFKCGIFYKKWEAVEAKKNALESEQKKQSEAKAKRLSEAKAKRMAAENAQRVAEEEVKRAAEKKRQEWEVKKAITAKITTKEIQSGHYKGGGIEGKLQGVGTFFLVVGIIGGILCFIYSEATITPVLIPIGIVAFLQGLMFFYLFRGAADIIRLLKKLNGLPYGGDIFEVSSFSNTRDECSECGFIVSDSEAKFCNQCGRLFRV